MADVAAITLRVNSSQAEANVRRMKGSLNSLNRSAKQVGQSFRSMGYKMSAAITAPFLLTAKAAVSASAEFEKARIAFGVFIRDVDRGAEVFDSIVELAAETPLNVSALQKSAQILLATGAATADSLIPTLKNLGDVSRADSGILERMALNLGQVASQGRLTGRELRDFARAGIPLIKVLAKQIGVTEDKMRKMVSSGAVSYKQVQQAFKAMSSAGGQFADLMKKMAHTLGGRWTTAVDNVRIALSEMADLFRNQLKGALNLVIRFAKVFRNLKPEIQRIIVILSLVAASIGPMLIALGTAIGLVAALKVAFAFILPLILPIVAIVAKLTIALGVVALAAEGLRRAFDLTWSDIIAGVVNFSKNVIGFIANFRHNWELLTDWVGKNWRAMLDDMSYNTGMLIANLVKNAVSIFNTLYIATGVIMEYISKNWEMILGNMIVIVENFAEKVGTIMYDAGKNMINGLRDGIIRNEISKWGLPDWLGGDKKSTSLADKQLALTGTLGEKLKEVWKNATFSGITEGWRKTTGALPKFRFDMFKEAKEKERRGASTPDGEDDGRGGPTEKLAGAFEAGSIEAFKLLKRESGDKIPSENKDANVRTAMEISALNERGVKIRGVKTVDSFSYA